MPTEGGTSQADEVTVPAPLREDLVRKLEQSLTEEQSASRLPTIAVGLARGGHLVWWGARGSAGIVGEDAATAAAQYRMGSITKTFVAVLVMRLREEGAVDLESPIGAHIPELADLPVSIGQLLSHTSGLPAETPAPWWERAHGISFDRLIATSLRRSDLLWRPGRKFHYSNVGFAVLGELVSRKRSAPFSDVVQNELLGPLAMGRTTARPVAPFARGFAVHPHADLLLEEPEHDAVAMAPAGQLWSTIEDLAIWSGVLAGERPDILSEEALGEMREPIAVVDAPGQPWVSAYGLGLFITNQAGRRRYGHTGGMPGHWAVLLIDDVTKDAVVAFANSTYQGLRPAFFDDLLSLFSSEQPRQGASGHPVGTEPRDAPADLLGTWYWGPVQYAVASRRDGRLELRGAHPGRDCTFHANGDGTFRGESGYFDGETLAVRRAADGTVSHLDIASFVFTRAPYDPRADIPGGVDEKGWQPW